MSIPEDISWPMTIAKRILSAIEAGNELVLDCEKEEINNSWLFKQQRQNMNLTLQVQIVNFLLTALAYEIL